MRRLLLFAGATILCFAASQQSMSQTASTTMSGDTDASSAPRPDICTKAPPSFDVAAVPRITVSGNGFKRDGSSWIPRGINFRALVTTPEFALTNLDDADSPDPWADYTSSFIYDDNQLNLAHKYWHTDTVRFQVSQYALSRTSAETYYPSRKDYLTCLKNAVATAQSHGFTVILAMQHEHNLHDKGVSSDFPTPNTWVAWQQLNTEYADNPGVVYELYNEPVGSTDSANWKIWRDGDSDQGSVVHLGMQDLVDDLRQSGSRNVFIAEGMNLGKSFEGFRQTMIKLGTH